MTVKISIQQLKENKTYKDMMPFPNTEDYQALKESIEKYGIKIPIVVNDDYEIIDGYSRYYIAREIGLEEIPCKVISFKDKFEEQEYIILSNLHRRHLNNAQKAEIGLKLLEIEEERARERQKELGQQLGKLGGRGIRKGTEKYEERKRELLEQAEEQEEGGKTLTPMLGEGFLEEGKGEAIEIVAEKVGIGKETLRKAKKIKEKAEEDERIKKYWQEAIKGKKSINSVYKLIEREEKIKKLEEKIKSLPKLEGKYQVIVIDPPWPYGTKYDPDSRRVASPYPEMSIEELEQIKLPADDNCILWLWTTNAFLHDAFHLMEKWGFEYKTMLTWIKDKIGVGEWLRGQTEHCLLGIKGKPVIKLTNQSTALFAPVRGHSRKPDEFYEMVDKMCVGRKLDYFGTKNREGWDIYGTAESSI